MANKYLAAEEAGNNRKSNYNLSEASKKSKTEFGEANTAASLLYERFKKIMGQKWERERFDRFKKLILSILRSGHSSLAGKRKLWDGNIGRLLGYELNPMLKNCL